MRAPFLVLVLVLVLVLGCGSTSPTVMSSADSGPSPDAGTEIPDAGPPAICPEGIAFLEQSGKIVVDVAINGGTYTFVLDTGAPYSVADTSIQSMLGAGPYDVALGDTKVTLKSIVFDTAKDLRLPGVVGILGADVFGKTALTIDYPRSRLWMQPARDEDALLACAHVEAKPAEVPFVQKYYLFVDGKAEGQDGYFLVDTGASLGAMPDVAFDLLDKTKPRNTLQGFYTPAAIGTFWARLGSVGSYDVGGKKVSRILVRTVADGVLPPAPSPQFSGKTFFGVLPSGYMRNFMVTVDYPAKKLRLDASKTATLTDPNQYWTTGIGIGSASTSPPITVAQVLPKSSAEDQGVQIGDRILAINGMNVDAMDPYARPWRLVSPPPAMKIPVTLSRGNQAPFTVMLETRDLLLP